MNQAKYKQQKKKIFLEQHPTCCYCGNAANTTDHCPPRSLFLNRQWPEGYEFPACFQCNQEGRSNEQIIAFLYRISLKHDQLDDESINLLKGIFNNRREVVEEWFSGSRSEGHQWLRQTFGDIAHELRRRGHTVITLGPKTHKAMDYFGKKLGTALYYKYIGRRLTGRLFCKSIQQHPR